MVVVKSSVTRGCDMSLGQRVNVSLPPFSREQRRIADAEIDEGPLGGSDSSDIEIKDPLPSPSPFLSLIHI